MKKSIRIIFTITAAAFAFGMISCNTTSGNNDYDGAHQGQYRDSHQHQH